MPKHFYRAACNADAV